MIKLTKFIVKPKSHFDRGKFKVSLGNWNALLVCEDQRLNVDITIYENEDVLSETVSESKIMQPCHKQLKLKFLKTIFSIVALDLLLSA